MKAAPKSLLDGQIFEIMLRTRDGDPYFVYYKSNDYYRSIIQPMSLADAIAGNLDRAEQWRTRVSEKAAKFVIEYMAFEYRVDERGNITSFSHNLKHTNVLAYVASLTEWYPIRHSDLEPEDTTQTKVALVNRDRGRIGDFISIRDASPS